MSESLDILVLGLDGGGTASVVRVLSSLPGFAITAREADYPGGIRALRDAEPDLAVVILPDDPSLGLSVIDDVHRIAPATRVLALAQREDADTIVSAMRAGADEFLTLPPAPTALLKLCIKISAARRAAPQSTRNGEVWVAHAPKPGVGATTLVANLAIALRQAGRETAVVDLDFHSGDLALYLNVSPTYSLRDIAENPKRLDQLFLQGTMTRHPSGLDLLAAPQHRPGALPIEVSGQQSCAIVDLLCSMYDVILVDTPAVPSPAILAAVSRASRLFLLTDRSVPAVRACLHALDWLRNEGVDVDRVVELIVNKHGRLPVEIPSEEVSKTLKLPLRACFARDDAAALAAINNGLPLKDVRGGQPLAAAIADLVSRDPHDGEQKRSGLLRLFTAKARRA
jgi:pilus assembly protein CpaE